MAGGIFNAAINWNNPCISGWQAFGAGAVGGFVGGFLLNPAAGGAVAGALTNGLTTYQTSGGDWGATLVSAGTGAGVGLISGGFGGAVSKNFGDFSAFSNPAGEAFETGFTVGVSDGVAAAAAANSPLGGGAQDECECKQ